jgi:trk system potassium uptake protein TrkH
VTAERTLSYLKHRYGRIFFYLGDILTFLGYLMLLPTLVCIFYPEESYLSLTFVLAALITNFLGLSIKKRFENLDVGALTHEESEIIVFLSWMIAVIISAYPIAQLGSLNFSQAIFESVSGWTTTGLSVVDVENAPRILLFWRSLIQLAGGAGLAIIMVSAITGSRASGISISEGRGDQLVPHVKKSAEIVLTIYLGYALAGTLAYKFAGMSLFDALNHSFAAVSTGGFSTKAASIGHWDSLAIEIVTLPLMFLGSLSFLSAWMAIEGKFKNLAENGEIKIFCVFASLATLLIFWLTCWKLYPGLNKSIRVAIFETVSALTTTGFSTVPYNDWNSPGIMTMIILMLVGGGSCSTAGGLKQIRVWILYQQIKCEIYRFFYPPKTVLELEINEGDSARSFSDARFRNLAVFFSIYIFSYFVGVLVLTANGASVQQAMFEFASSLGTVGLSVGITSANMPDTVLWVETAGMFLGRLEFFVVIVSLLRLFKDTRLYFSRK